MKKFEEKKFNIPELKGITRKTIEEHLKLYSGYVKNLNDTLEGKQDIRRLGFEYNGMRNHEVYFSSLEGGARSLEENSPLKKKIADDFGSFEKWLGEFKTLALTRGIGWAMLYYDHKDSTLINAWVDEQHLGQLQDCALILGLDMWEHSYVADYQPSGKKTYVEDFFENINWETIEGNFKNSAR